MVVFTICSYSQHIGSLLVIYQVFTRTASIACIFGVVSLVTRFAVFEFVPTHQSLIGLCKGCLDTTTHAATFVFGDVVTRMDDALHIYLPFWLHLVYDSFFLTLGSLWLLCDSLKCRMFSHLLRFFYRVSYHIWFYS